MNRGWQVPHRATTTTTTTSSSTSTSSSSSSGTSACRAAPLVTAHQDARQARTRARIRRPRCHRAEARTWAITPSFQLFQRG